MQTAKASRKQSSLSGKESAQGCIPKRLLGRPDEALGGGNQGPSSRGRGRLRGFLELRRPWGFSLSVQQMEKTQVQSLGPEELPGEGNGNPLQCSCLENPRDRGAWWAAVYGVAQSRT